MIRDGLPSFSTYSEAAAHYLYPGEAVALHPSDGLLVVRIADTRCWIEHMHFAPTSIAIKLKGSQVDGARVEIIGLPQRQEKRSGSSGRVKLSLPAALAQSQMLMVSSGDSWLDYRFLGQMNFLENRSDTSFDPPDRSTQMALLAVQGEQQTIEYKRQLPTTPAERKNLARTVVGFANSQGGWLIYGLDRDSSSGTRVVGVQSTPNLADDIVRTIRDSVTPDPGIEIVQAEVEGKGLLAVVVPARRKRFFALNTTPPQFFIRRQANTFPATPSEIRELAETLADQPAGV